MPDDPSKAPLVSAIRHAKEQLQKVLLLKKAQEKELGYVDRYQQEVDKIKAEAKAKRRAESRPNRTKRRKVDENIKESWRKSTAKYRESQKQVKSDERIQLPVLMLHEFLMKHKRNAKSVQS